jgi:hypothetical protein
MKKATAKQKAKACKAVDDYAVALDNVVCALLDVGWPIESIFDALLEPLVIMTIGRPIPPNAPDKLRDFLGGVGGSPS